MALTAPDGQPMLMTSEVAAIFRVSPKTVSRWALAKKIDCVTTPGGHRRYRLSDVMALYDAERGEGK